MARVVWGVTVLLAWGWCGCTAVDPDVESDLPWNLSQPWESAPSLPFMADQGY